MQPAKTKVGDWNNPRPWRAEPMDDKDPSGFWRVVCLSRTGKGEAIFITHLTEKDAKAIEDGGNRNP